MPLPRLSWLRGWPHSSPNVEGAPSTGYRSTTTGLPHPSVPRSTARSRVPRGQRHGHVSRALDGLAQARALCRELPSLCTSKPGRSVWFSGT